MKNKLFVSLFLSIVMTFSCMGHMKDPGHGDKFDLDAAEMYTLIDVTVRVDKLTVYSYDVIDEKNKTAVTKLSVNRGTGAGSGVVINDPLGSFIVTAGHVCATPILTNIEVEKNNFAAILKLVSISISDIHGESHKTQLIQLDEKNDICILMTTDHLSQGASLAEYMPPLAGHLVAVGAPLGNFGKDLATVVEGRYAGLREGFATMTCQIDAGFSGGPVFYQGRVVGIVVATIGEAVSISLASPIDNIRKNLDIARTKISAAAQKKDATP